MNILYYTWNEYTFKDCTECMKALGWNITVISHPLKDYDIDDEFMCEITAVIRSSNYDCIFSFNYFPIISRICMEQGLTYISWVFDSPNITMDSVTLKNPCNAVFTFDYATYEMYRNNGINTVHYMPLAYNHRRLKKLVSQLPQTYGHEVSFLGTLYNNEYNFFDQINYIPPQLKGYIDGLINSQLLIYGYDLISELFNHEKCNELAKYVNIDMGPLYENYRDKLFCNMIHKKITVIERREFMQIIGKKYSLDLYSPSKPDNLSVNYCGYAEYMNQMPEIFYTSKINLNITLRSITTGIPLRIIDILGANGFLLTNYQQELAEYFTNGVDLVWYESREDLMDKINYYLNHDTERIHIADNGHKKAEELFTYEKLLPKIFNTALT